MYCTTKTYINIYYYIGISFEVLSYGTLCKHSLIVYYDLIWFLCINLMSYSCTYYLYFIFVTYFLLCLLSFWCHVLYPLCWIYGILNKWMNEKFYSHQPVHKRMTLYQLYICYLVVYWHWFFFWRGEGIVMYHRYTLDVSIRHLVSLVIFFITSKVQLHHRLPV